MDRGQRTVTKNSVLMENLQPRKVESSVQMQTGGAASLKKRFLVILLSSIINKGSIVPFWHCAVQVHQKPKKGQCQRPQPHPF